MIYGTPAKMQQTQYIASVYDYRLATQKAVCAEIKQVTDASDWYDLSEIKARKIEKQDIKGTGISEMTDFTFTEIDENQHQQDIAQANTVATAKYDAPIEKITLIKYGTTTRQG